MEWVDSPELLLQWGGPAFQFPLDHKQLDDYVNLADNYVFKVVDSDTSRTVGHISLGKVDLNNESARIGKVFVSPSERGNGIGEQMVDAILSFSFNELQLHKVSLGVFDFNHAAIRCYEKAGFKKDGLLRDHRKIKNEFWNLYEMSLLQSEWKSE